MVRQLEPIDLIDRIAEQELFAQLLGDSPRGRLLTICDGGGRGKSSLLLRLEYNCRYQMSPPVPACIVELDRIEPTPFGFVSRVVESLPTSSRQLFARYSQLDVARRLKDAAAFEDPAVRLHRLQGNAAVGTQQGGVAAGIYAEQATFHLTGTQDFTEEHEQLARQRCVGAFFEDLRAVCAAQPVVLFLDAWEKCDTGLRSWLREDFLRAHCLNDDHHLRPALAAVVVAGRPHHHRDERYGLRTDEFRDLVRAEAEFTEAVRSIRSLSAWETDHVQEFMVLNGCDAPQDHDIDYLRRKLGEGLNLVAALQIVDSITSLGG